MLEKSESHKVEVGLLSSLSKECEILLISPLDSESWSSFIKLSMPQERLTVCHGGAERANQSLQLLGFQDPLGIPAL